jgi:hypothetical protein
MLQGAANVPVEVAADAAARELLDELALSTGRTVERASVGTFLTSPAKQPDREPQAVPVVPTAPVGPKPRRTRGNGKVKLRVIRKYPTLSTTFFKGSIAGQINSVFKTREITPLKVSDYKQALADGACTLGKRAFVKNARRQTANPRGPADSGLTFHFSRPNCRPASTRPARRPPNPSLSRETPMKTGRFDIH